MKTKIISSIILCGLLYSNNALVTLNSTPLPRSNSENQEVIMSIESDDPIKGLQFDLHYNPEELSFNGTSSLLDDFMFEYRLKDCGIVKGVLFSMTGRTVNSDQITDIICFDFDPADGFIGESKVEFANLILAGEHGVKIPVTASSFIVSAETLIPKITKLQACYPNPFNPVTTINYDLAMEGFVDITVFDITGRFVIQLVSTNQQADHYQITWNASDIASGVYFLKMVTPDYTSTQKLLLVK